MSRKPIGYRVTRPRSGAQIVQEEKAARAAEIAAEKKRKAAEAAKAKQTKDGKK